MPKVSFILPAYKRRFLKESIDSILAQTCRDFELVIVDDKSPENLYEVIKEYSWEATFDMLPDGGRKWIVDGIPVRYYQNAENIGGKDLVAAWNHAMKYATGEWCVLASDDDKYLPSYLGEMLRLVDKYKDVDLVHCRIAKIDIEGNWVYIGDQRIEYETQIQMTYSRGVRRSFQVAPDFMFRRSALYDIGGFVSFPLAWYSDDATWMMLAKNGVACSGEVLFGFRMSGENISSRIDNIERKIEAGEKFRDWFDGFIKGLVTRNKEDEVLLQNMHSGVYEKINELSCDEIRQIKSFLAWYRCIRKMRLSARERRSFLYVRYPFLRMLRLLLPKFRKKVVGVYH